MNSFEKLCHDYTDFLTKKFNLSPNQVSTIALELNTNESKSSFGDLSSNAAMVLAKQLKQSPRTIAQEIIDSFCNNSVEKIEIAGPGFINIFLTTKAFNQWSHEIFTQNSSYFTPSTKENKSYSIEFVSANPTGPLHFGHGRGGIIGDVLGNILHFLGHSVTKEFYINDAGAQMQKLGNTLKIRCLQALGSSCTLPENSYQGEYMVDLAKQCIEEFGTEIEKKDDTFFIEYGKKELLAKIKSTLLEYGISYDVWFSEKSLHTSDAINKALEVLKKRGFLYEKDNALWFKSTEFNDDKDRVVKKSDGSFTYVAADIAYMLNKVNRGASDLIMILGHDHHSYAVRLQALQQALDLEKFPLTVLLYQLVKMKNHGEVVRMSKRAGNIVTLHDIIKEVGKDVARFFFLHRKADAQLEFDLKLALEKTDANPVYYVQYAYVRTLSILKKAKELHPEITPGHDNNYQPASHERNLIKKIIQLKTLLTTIEKNHQTHLLTYYSIELAQAFHNYYSHVRVIDPSNKNTMQHRLMLITLVRDTLGLVLKLLGLSQPSKM